MQYIILNNKTPTHGFKNGEGTYTKDEAMAFDNVAVVVPKGHIVLDFDTTSDAELMLKIVDALDLKTKVMKTTRGIHCWFKASEKEPKNFIKQRLAIGLYCDRKSGGRNAYVKIKQDGEPREWIRQVKMKDIQEVPKWLSAISTPANKFNFKGMGDGSGRNQELFDYIVYLQAKGFTRDEIRETIPIINDYIFEDPLSESEIASICRDEAFKPDDEIQAQIKKANFNHVEIAEELIEEHSLINYNNTIHEYKNGCYVPCETLGKYIRNKVYAIKNNQRNEVVSYINDMERVNTRNLKLNPYIINVKNTRFNLKTNECLPFDKSIIDFSQLPVTYDATAYCADLDKMLNRVFLADREVINLFQEMLGATLLKHSKYQKAFLFYGGGSNGKSTILDLIKTFLGTRNYSAIALEKVTDRFNTAELENRLANIGDDIDNVTIKDTGTLKKLFSGNSIMVERKGERPYTIEPYATHIYSCNNIPRSFDKSDGFYRRWIMIPFDAKFTTDDEDYDPLIGEKITTDEALSYLLNLAIRGARRLITRGKFTEPRKVKIVLDKYKIDNSTVLTYLDDQELSETEVLEKPKDVLYSEFVDWCKLSGIKNINITGKKAFYKEIIDKFGLDDKPLQKSDGKRYFMEKL